MATEGSSSSADIKDSNDKDDVTKAVSLVAQGRRNIICGEIPIAVNQFQEACKILASHYGETAKECADAYFYYGQALLELARMETGVLGNALQGVEVEEEEEEKPEDKEIVEGPPLTEEERMNLRKEVVDAMAEEDKEKCEENGKEKSTDEKENGAREENMESDDKVDKENDDISHKTTMKEDIKFEDEQIIIIDKEGKDKKENTDKNSPQKDSKDKKASSPSEETKVMKETSPSKESKITKENNKDEDKKENGHNKDIKSKPSVESSDKMEDVGNTVKIVKLISAEAAKALEKSVDKKLDEPSAAVKKADDESSIVEKKTEKNKEMETKAEAAEELKDNESKIEVGREKVENKKSEEVVEVNSSEKAKAAESCNSEEKMEKDDLIEMAEENVEKKPDAEKSCKEKDENGKTVVEDDKESGETKNVTAEAGETSQEEEMEEQEDEETAEDNEGEEDGEKKEESEEDPDDVPNLQLAWEMLELSKMILVKQEDKESKLKLAQSYLKLGEVGLETENYEQSISDFKECLTLQEIHLEPTDRLIAETHYQLGLAYGFDKQFDASIEHYKAAVKVIESKIEELEKVIKEKATSKGKELSTPDDPVSNAEQEIKELREILPDIVAKVEDSEEEKKNHEELKKLAKEALGGALPHSETSKSESSTSQKTEVKALDTNLIRRKRKPEEDETDSNKKSKQENGSGDAKEIKENGHMEKKVADSKVKTGEIMEPMTS